MSKRNDVWGIEVGANAIKAIRLVLEGSQPRVAQYEVLPFKKILTTPDLDIQEAIQVNLDQFLAHHDVQHSTVVLSVPGHLAFARFAKLPPVEPKKIPDIVRFEAVQQIPFPIDQVEWDYQVFMQEDSPDVEVGIFAITKERVSQFLSNFRTLNLPVHAITLSPLAVYNAMAYDMDITSDSDGMVLMDIGTTSTDVIIAECGRIWLRTLPIGGNNFTDALVRAFKLSFPKAEKLKREAGTSKYARQIFQAMRPVFADLVQEVQRSMGYYQSLNRDAHLTKLLGIGSTFRLPGLQKFLKQQLQIDVIRPDAFKKIAVEGTQAADFTDQALNLATAYGLALQGLGLAKVNANILPTQIIKQRLWRTKQPWFLGAAGLLLAATGAAAGKWYMEASVFNRNTEENQPQVAAVIRDAENNKREWDRSGGEDPRQRIENLRRVQDYRDLWPKILADISEATASLNPQPQLLEHPLDSHKKITRTQRRRLIIESVEVVYSGQDPTVIGMGGIGTPPGMPPGTPPGMPPGMRPGMPSAATPGDANVPTTGQYFTITLKGYTPFGEGYQLIANEFVKWLKDNAHRPDRPYILAIKDIKDVEVRISPRQVTESTPPGGTVTPTPRPPSGFNTFGGNRDRAVRPEERTTEGRTAEFTDYRAFLPQRPLSDEPRTSDSQFTISWKIEILTPERARQTVLASLPSATGGTPGTPPTSAVPSTNNPGPKPTPNASENLR